MKNNDDKNFLKDEEYQKKHKKTTIILRIVGISLLVVGITFSIIGITSFTSGSTNMIFCFLGFPMIAFGFFLTSLSFMKKMTKYQMSEHAKVQQDYINYMRSNTKDSVGEVADRILQREKVKCAKCGMENDNDAKFCKKCGEPLKKVCPKCNTVNDGDAMFCDNCGEKLN